jgi:hypothetical protein
MIQHSLPLLHNHSGVVSIALFLSSAAWCFR